MTVAPTLAGSLSIARADQGSVVVQGANYQENALYIDVRGVYYDRLGATSQHGGSGKIPPS